MSTSSVVIRYIRPKAPGHHGCEASIRLSDALVAELEARAAEPGADVIEVLVGILEHATKGKGRQRSLPGTDARCLRCKESASTSPVTVDGSVIGYACDGCRPFLPNLPAP